jgi:N-acetyltransferase
MALVNPSELGTTLSSFTSPPPTATLVPVDPDVGLFCHPQSLPTPLGIPRLFVPSEYRRQGIATKLLNAVLETFIHGCKLDPREGDVAFTQPTSLGRAVMDCWGGGNVRIYQE